MFSRNRYPLRSFSQSLHRAARPLRGAVAVLAVAAAVASLVVSGRDHAFARVAAVTAAHRPTTTTATPSVPDVRSALRLFGLTGDRPTAKPSVRHATRSHRRAPLHRWVRPNGGPLSSRFGMRWGRLHAGIDLAGGYGSTIVAATDGCISYAGPMSGYGEVMQISDWDGTETVYGHMSSFLRRSGCVHAGEPIALVGSSGDATGPHLHFEVHVDGVPIDPIPFLAKRGVWI